MNSFPKSMNNTSETCSYYNCSMNTFRRCFMSQLSEKELNTIKDLLSEEELLVKKFQMLAQHAQNKKCD